MLPFSTLASSLCCRPGKSARPCPPCRGGGSWAGHGAHHATRGSGGLGRGPRRLDSPAGTQSSLGFLLHQMYNAVTVTPACLLCKAVLAAQTVKTLPPMKETGVPALGQEDPLEQGMATHSSILAWRISWAEEPGGPQSRGLQRVGHD